MTMVYPTQSTIGYDRMPARTHKIPRPWLAQHRDRLQHSNRGIHDGPSCAVWEKPEWTVSWSKLKACFFGFDSVERSPDTDSLCISSAADAYFRNEVRHALVKTSFDDCYAHNEYLETDDDNDYESQSTASDDSYSTCSDISVDCERDDESLTDDDDDDDDSLQPPPHYEPQAWPRMSLIEDVSDFRRLNLPTASQRRRSLDCRIGTNAAQSSTQKQPLLDTISRPAVIQQRRSTADYSRASSTSSRHQRTKPFSFSARSMEKIYSSNTCQPHVPPPLLVLCDKEKRQLGRDYFEDMGEDDSEYLSPLGYTDKPRWETDTDRRARPQKRSSPRTKRSKTSKKNHKRCTDSQQTPSRVHRVHSSGAIEMSARRPDVSDTSNNEFTPDYMRRNPVIDAVDSRRVVLAGWVACSPTDAALLDKLKSKRKVSSQNMHYIRVVEDGCQRLLFQVYDAGLVLRTEFEPRPGWKCETREVSAQIGQCVVLLDDGDQPVCTILPVSLCDSFFTPEGRLVPTKDFNHVRKALFVEAVAGAKAYAPTEQQDSVFFIMFALDCILRNWYRQ